MLRPSTSLLCDGRVGYLYWWMAVPSKAMHFWPLGGALTALLVGGLLACGGSSNIGSPESVSTRLASSATSTGPSSPSGTPVVTTLSPDSILTPESSTKVVNAPLDQAFELRRGETGRIAGANASVTLAAVQTAPQGCSSCPASVSLRVTEGDGQVTLSYAFTPDQPVGTSHLQSAFGYSFTVSSAMVNAVILTINKAR
jgi:hypothetical protein